MLQIESIFWRVAGSDVIAKLELSAIENDDNGGALSNETPFVFKTIPIMHGANAGIDRATGSCKAYNITCEMKATMLPSAAQLTTMSKRHVCTYRAAKVVKLIDIEMSVSQ